MDINDAGHWEGEVFIFTPPVVLDGPGGHPMTVRGLDCAVMDLPEDMSREDVVHAMLTGRVVEDWSCPSCGEPISDRYRQYGVCRDCYGTTDDPQWPRS